MDISLERLRPFLLEPTIKDREIAALLESIKAGYTTNREGLEKKVWSDKEVSAYAAFYLPTNYKKFSFLMNQLPREIRAQLGSCEVIDFGTGPGTYLLSFLDYFGSDESVGLIGIDKDEVMLKQARRLIEGLFPEVSSKIKWRNDSHLLRSKRDRLLIFGNSLNELSVDQVKQVIQSIDPQFIFFIEPGTPSVFDSIHQVRGWLAKSDFDCFYPCPNISSACPVATRVSEGEEDWCHQVWRGTHDGEVERIGQMAKMDRKAMPFIGHFYGKSVVQAGSNNVRFVRYINESKHSFEWEVCLLKEEGLKLMVFEIPKRILPKKLQKYMKKMSVGESFSFEIIKKLSEERWRVSVEIESV